jgi:hypothetical protein
MTEEEWHLFLYSGSPIIATVGTLHSDLCREIGASSPIIRMHHAYALKCSQKHGIDPYQFPMLPITIEFGRCICDHPQHLTFFHFDEVVFGSWFHATLKTDKSGTEIWVNTFHQTRPREVERKCSKSPILRPEKW